MNVFNAVTSPRVFSYFNLTYGLKPQISAIEIVTVYRRSIFQVEWLITMIKTRAVVHRK